VEGARLLKNATAFSSCVGGFEEVIQCPAGAAGQVRPRRSLGDEEKEKRKRLVQPLSTAGLKRLEGLGAGAGQAHLTPLERKSTTPCLEATESRNNHCRNRHFVENE